MGIMATSIAPNFLLVNDEDGPFVGVVDAENDVDILLVKLSRLCINGSESQPTRDDFAFEGRGGLEEEEEEGEGEEEEEMTTPMARLPRLCEVCVGDGVLGSSSSFLRFASVVAFARKFAVKDGGMADRVLLLFAVVVVDILPLLFPKDVGDSTNDRVFSGVPAAIDLGARTDVGEAGTEANPFR